MPVDLPRRRFLAAATATTVVVAAGDLANLAPRAAAAVKPVYPRLAPKLALRTTQSWHLARRAAHAPTPAMVAKIESMGAAAWVAWQLTPSKVPDSACQAMLDKTMPWLRLTSKELRDVSGNRTWLGATLVTHSTALRHIFSNRVLYESVVEVMSDQVYVSSQKASGWILDFDRSVVRRYAHGRFSDFLGAALTHPALLMYLDNEVNYKKSPNENLGRELLELHTVGQGGYTEDDVRNSALLLTGHSLDWQERTYRYRPENHYVGPLKIMGFTHPNSTAAGGPEVLAAYADYLAHHPRTASRIARRLAVRFVSDDPSASLVADLAKVYLDSGTDISAVVRALFASREFAASVGQKWRRPQEWLAAMVAAGHPTWRVRPGSSQEDPWKFLSYHCSLLTSASHLPRSWPAVNGYPDVAPHWMSTSTMLAHWNAAEAVAGGWDHELVRSHSWKTLLKLKSGQNVWTAVAKMTKTLTGYDWRHEDLLVVASMLVSNGVHTPPKKHKLTSKEIKQHLNETVRMIFASPYFMIR